MVPTTFLFIATSGLTISRIDLLKVAGAAGLASALPARTMASLPGHDPKIDFMVGPEKNAISDFEVVPMQLANSDKIGVARQQHIRQRTIAC